MRDAAVEDVRSRHAVAQRAHAGDQLRDHALPGTTVVDELLEAVRVDPRDERRLVGKVRVHAGDVGEEHELLGAERLRDRAGHGVGVDVVRLAGLVHPDGGDHGDQLLAEQPVQDRRVDRADVAHEAEALVALGDHDQAGVLAREPDRVGAVLVQRRDHLTIHLAHQRHPRDVDGLGVRDPQAVDELGGLAEARHEVGDLRASPVHHHRVHADEAHEHDVLRPLIGQLCALHRVPAVLDDDRLARELADVRHRLREDVGLGLGVGPPEVERSIGRGVAHDVVRFSSMYACERSVKSMRADASPASSSQTSSISSAAMTAPSASATAGSRASTPS